MCPQGEQCNIVPDNVDDIVADIAQEEKEEGLPVLFHSFSFFFLVQDSGHTEHWLAVTLSPLTSSPCRWHAWDLYLLQLVSVVGLQLGHLWKGQANEAKDAEGSAGPERSLPTHRRFWALHGAGVQRRGWVSVTLNNALKASFWWTNAALTR